MRKKVLAKWLIILLVVLLAQIICINNYKVLGNNTENTSEVETENYIEDNFTPIDINHLNVQVNTGNQRYKGRERKAQVNIYNNNEMLQLDKDYILTYLNNVDAGIATVTIQGIEKYTGTITKQYTIIPQHLKNLDVYVSTASLTYTGQERNALVNNIYYNGMKLELGRDYTVTYNNNVKTGKAQVIIRGQNNYTGVIRKTYKIVPKKAVIKNVIMNTKNTKATITWKKDSQADGYVIYRATSKNGKYTKIKTITKNNTTKYVAKKLNSKKTYYFKIISYKLIDNKKVYSKRFSDSKTNTGLIGKVTLTSTTSSTSRNTNLKVASKAINGKVFKPGETFNWFKVVGKATTYKGYKSATVFLNKKPVPGVGGGICQVSTTLYQAAIEAGLNIVERHTHSLPVTYTTAGNDATVAYPVKNLKIKNNKNYAIKFVTKSSKNKTTCKIYRVNY